MIKLSEVLIIHERLIHEFGGLNGVRDEGMLLSSIARPFQTFAGEDLYAGPFDKCAAVLESIVRNHPFLDGNKRTGIALAELLLMAFGKKLHATEDEKYDFVISIAEGRLTFDEIVVWLGGHTL
jgi:death on curing protein